LHRKIIGSSINKEILQQLCGIARLWDPSISTAEDIHDTLMCLLLATIEGIKAWADQSTKSLNFPGILQVEQAGYSLDQIILGFISAPIRQIKHDITEFFMVGLKITLPSTQRWHPSLSPIKMFLNMYIGTNVHNYEGFVCMIVVEFTADKQLTFRWNSQCSIHLHGHFMRSTCVPMLVFCSVGAHKSIYGSSYGRSCLLVFSGGACTYLSEYIVPADFSLLAGRTAATKSKEPFQCVNWEK
jgi:hypothetical protein